MPPAFEEREVAAIQALSRGNATMEQQKLALSWIIGSPPRAMNNSASGYYDLSFRPGGLEGDRATVLAEGRRFVGGQILKLINLKIGQLRREQ